MGRTARSTAAGAVLAVILVVAGGVAAPADAAGSSSGAAGAAEAVAGAAAQRSNVPGLTSARYVNSFVVRSGARMTVAGRPLRFSGANAEDLGLENYGPNPSAAVPAGSERYLTRYEIDDLFATAHEMVSAPSALRLSGACGVRSQPAANS